MSNNSNINVLVAVAAATPGSAREAATRNVAKRAISAHVAASAAVREAVTDRQPLPTRPPTLMAALVAAKARKAEAKASLAAELREQLENAVGKGHSIPRLEAMRLEAREAMEGEELTAFEAQLEVFIQVRKDLEKAEAEVKRLAAVSTTQGMEAYLDRKVEAEAQAKAVEMKAKAQAKAEAADKAKEERIAQIVADLGDITPKTAHAVTCFLRGNKWDYRANEGGRKALLAAAGRAAKEFNEARAARALAFSAALKAKEEAEAAKAPLTHKMGLKGKK